MVEVWREHMGKTEVWELFLPNKNPPPVCHVKSGRYCALPAPSQILCLFLQF